MLQIAFALESRCFTSCAELADKVSKHSGPLFGCVNPLATSDDFTQPSEHFDVVDSSYLPSSTFHATYQYCCVDVMSPIFPNKMSVSNLIHAFSPPSKSVSNLIPLFNLQVEEEFIQERPFPVRGRPGRPRHARARPRAAQVQPARPGTTPLRLEGSQGKNIDRLREPGQVQF